METLIYIGLLSVTWLFVEGAAPIQFLKRILNLHNETKIKSPWWNVVRQLVNCCMCSGFWIGLGFYFFTSNKHFFLMACLVSVGSEVYCLLINVIFYNLRKWLKKI